MAKKPKKRQIKAHRKPKIVRDRSWKQRVFGAETDDTEALMPATQRIVPRGRDEDRVKVWSRLDEELKLEAQQPGEDSYPTDWLQGTVTRISTSLYHVDLGHETILCGARGSLSAEQTGYTNVVAVGDNVLVSRGTQDHGVIERVLARQSILARADPFNPDKSQIIVANVNQFLIVASWEEPALWLELIDRSLIAALEGKLKPLICLNKVDLALDIQECYQDMAPYEALGYTVLYTSTVTGQGIDELREHLVGNETVVAGASGVGKSSLLMEVQPDLELRTAEVSYYSGEGRHTTTQVSLLKLEQGGYVVDTPGIRALGLVTVHRSDLVLFFPEIAALASECRFSNCAHMQEPGCAVIHAVERGDIPWSRYASYLSIYESLPEYYTEP